MNILILNWRDPKNPFAGGAETVTMAHAQAWVKNGHRVTWVASLFDGALPKDSINGITVVRFRFVHVAALLFYLRNRRFVDVVVDEIHGIPFFTPLYVRKPIIAFIHEIAREIWDAMYPFPLNMLGKLSEKITFYLYKKIPFWTDAPSTKEELVAYGIPANRIVAIPCPISNKPRKEIPAKALSLTFISVSRLVKMKGIEDTLRAFSYIVRDKKSARLWIVGSGMPSYVHRLKTIASNYKISDRVTFWGFIPDRKKLELMGKAHILLHASIKEGWGLVVLEAACQGTPSIVYNVHGLRDTVLDGKTGVVVKKNTPENLATSALELMANQTLYKKMQKNGRSWSASFSWLKSTRSSLEFIKRYVRI